MGLVFNSHINTGNKLFNHYYQHTHPKRTIKRKKGGKLTKENRKYLKLLEVPLNFKVTC